MRGKMLATAFIIAALSANPLFAQEEDLTNAPDAPTRIIEQQDLRCTLEGLKVTRKASENGVDINVAFLLTRKPAVYFHYFDVRKKAVVFDFYDTRMGESLFDSIREPPFTSSKVEYSRIDLNRDVSGLKADIRDVVRVSLFTTAKPDYNVQEDESVITLSLKWNVPRSVPVKRKMNALYWQLPLVVLAAGVAGFGLYEILLKN